MIPEQFQKEQIELKRKHDALVLSKQEHESKLARIKNMIRTERSIPPEKYKSFCQSQDAHNRSLVKIGRELVPIKNRLREIALMENQGNGNNDVSIKPVIEELVALRGEYQNFAADHTRVSSMRQMAAEFVLKLNPIIKRAVRGE